MAILSCQILLKTTDNIAANFTTNTIHFDVDTGAVLPGLDETMQDIVNQITSTYEGFRTRLGGLQQTGHEITFYDLGTPKPRVPFRMYDLDFTAALPQTVLPHEVAIVSSFKARREAGKSDRNRRNRVYIGPLAASTLDQATGRVGDATRLAIAAAWEEMASESADSDDWTWVIYSPTLEEAYPVWEGFVDNAFDTQRRRGVSSTARAVWQTDSA